MLKTLWSWFWRGTVMFVGLFCLSLLALRWIPPTFTPLMVWRLAEAPFGKYHGGLDYRWVPLEKISPWVMRGVIASEDAAFWTHSGVDWRAVEHAKRVNPSRVRKGKPPLGASTITMQTARSVFLVPSRTMVRKALEVGLAYTTEITWGKRRVLEMYLNVVEWGDGIYGIEAASQRYFGRSAFELNRDQAARLIAVLPNPRKFNAAAPSPYVRRRAAAISRGMGAVDLRPLAEPQAQPTKGRKGRRK